MRIRRVEIRGFGKLRGSIELAPERCNLILAPNESGKSTLVAALITALYGLAPERRSKHHPIPAREAYRPWDGDPYGLAMDLTLGDESYTLRRHLGEERDEVLDGRTGKDIADQFRGSGGRLEFIERKIGLERDDFLRSALVLQQDVQSVRDGGEITLRLQKFASSQGGDITAGEAVACLERALTRYEGARLAGPGRVETEIKRLDERLAELRSRRTSLSDEYEAAGAEVAALEDLGARQEGLAAELHRLDYLRTRAIIDDLEIQIEDNEHATNELESLREERDSLAGYEAFPVEAEKEMSDLKGEADQLAGRLAEAKGSLERDAERPLTEVRRDLDGLGPLLEMTAEDGAALEAISVRMRDHRNQMKKARNKARRERRRLRDEDYDLKRVAALKRRFASLSPEDRRFVEGYRERVLELEAKIREAAAGEEERPKGGPRAAGTASPLRWVAAAIGVTLLGAAGVAWLGVHSLELSGGLAVGGVLALGLSLLIRGRRPRTDRPPDETTRSPLETVLARLRDRAESICAALGHEDVDTMVSELRTLGDLAPGSAELDEREEECRRIESALRATKEEASAILGRAGRPASAQAVRRNDVEKLRDDLGKLTRLRERETELTGRLERGREEVGALDSKLDDLHRRMREIVAKAAPEDTTLADATREELQTRYALGLERARRFRQLKGKLIPEAASSVAPADWLSKRLDEKRTLEKNLAEIQKRRPLDPVPEPAHSANHYLQEYRQVDDQFRKVQAERNEIFAQVGDLLRRYRDEVPKLTEECERLETARRRADRFSRAIRLAADLLQEISRESYEEWATALNERTNRALARLNPAYHDLRFDTDLSFTLEDVATGKRLDRDGVDAFLSSGARDQIYLAIRLAISDYFSAGTYRLPLILDDVLATADDERFDRALTYLAERVSQRHQLIVVSCQEERHRRWRDRHPELVEARLRSVALPAQELESV